MQEIWKPIKGYEGLYQVSDQGRVKSLERKNCFGRTVKERILKPYDKGYGYLSVDLFIDGKRKQHQVHRLVCEAFHENPENKPQVNHKNEIKADNRACNLEWCTRRENCNFGTRNARIGEAVVKAQSQPIGQFSLDGELIKVWQSTHEAERQTGFNQGNISKVANGKRKTASGFIWKYV